MSPRPLTLAEAIAEAAAGNGPVTLEPADTVGPLIEVWYRDDLGNSFWRRRHKTEFAARETYNAMRTAVARIRRGESKDAA